MSLAEIIKIIKKETSLSSVDLAYILDVSPSTIVAYEEGRPPTIEFLEKLAEKLKINKEDLMYSVLEMEKTSGAIDRFLCAKADQLLRILLKFKCENLKSL